jgi:tetratricopeptide (TPR) repeat protein
MGENSVHTAQTLAAESDADIASLLRSAKVYVNSRQSDKARAVFERVLALDSLHPEAHYHLGQLDHRAQAYALAEQHYRAALAGATPFGRAYLALGLLYEELDEPEAAAVVYQQCVEADVSPKRIARARAALAKQAGQPHKVCAKCGRFTILTEFIKYGSGKKSMCPRCYGEMQLKKASGSLALNLGILIMSGIMWASCLLTRMINPLYALVNGALALFLSYVMIPLHEFAHAGMTWLVGGKVLEIRLGTGSPLWEKTWRGTKFSLRKYPVGGFCVPAFPERRFILARVFLSVAAGLVLSGLFVALLLPHYDDSRWLGGFAVVEALVWVNGLVLLLNLWPRKLALGNVFTTTDGGHLLRILIGKNTAELYHLNYYLLESNYALQNEEFARVAEVCRAGQALYPDNPYIENMLAVADLELGNLSEAAGVFKRELDALDQRGEETIGVTDEAWEVLRALLMNNLAVALMLDGGFQEFRPSVLDYAQQAYSRMSWHHAIESTWGAALVENGRSALGL